MMPSLDKTFMDIAVTFSKRSHCVSYQVAALATLENRIIACGINGTAPKMPNCDTIFPPKDSPEFDRDKHHVFSELYEIHAEQNLICFCAKHGISLCGSVVYVTLSPCFQCIKMLSVVGVTEIVYKNEYDKANISKILQYCEDMKLKIRKYGE